MNYYEPPYNVTDKMLNLVSSVSEKIQTININKNLSSKPRLRKNNKIQSIHSSLKIEANSLSIGQVVHLNAPPSLAVSVNSTGITFKLYFFNSS